MSKAIHFNWLTQTKKLIENKLFLGYYVPVPSESLIICFSKEVIALYYLNLFLEKKCE